MKRHLKATGLFFGFVFLAGGMIRAVQITIVEKTSLLSSVVDPLTLMTLGLSILMFGSGFSPILCWIQPLVLFAMTPLPFMTSHESFYGLGFFVMGVILLFRLGFFQRYRLPRLILCLAYLYGCELFAVVRNGKDLTYALTPIFVITVFLVFLYLTFQEKLAVYLRVPKPSFSLKGHGLSAAEGRYVKEIATGKNTKEIAAEHGVSESTVRNSLSRAYRKLGFEDRTAIAALAERYDIVD